MKKKMQIVDPFGHGFYYLKRDYIQPSQCEKAFGLQEHQALETIMDTVQRYPGMTSDELISYLRIKNKAWFWWLLFYLIKSKKCIAKCTQPNEGFQTPPVYFATQ